MLTHGAGSPKTRTDTGEGLHRVMSPPVPDSRAADPCQLACNRRGRVSARKDEDSYANVRLNWHACSQRLSRVGGACGQASLEDRVLTNSNTSKYIYSHRHFRLDDSDSVCDWIECCRDAALTRAISRSSMSLHLVPACALGSCCFLACDVSRLYPPAPPTETHNNKCVTSV